MLFSSAYEWLLFDKARFTADSLSYYGQSDFKYLVLFGFMLIFYKYIHAEMPLGEPQ